MQGDVCISEHSFECIADVNINLQEKEDDYELFKVLQANILNAT